MPIAWSCPEIVVIGTSWNKGDMESVDFLRRIDKEKFKIFS